MDLQDFQFYQLPNGKWCSVRMQPTTAGKLMPILHLYGMSSNATLSIQRILYIADNEILGTPWTVSDLRQATPAEADRLLGQIFGLSQELN